MNEPLSQITGLIANGYALYLQRDHTGVCFAELSRGIWPFKKNVRVSLDRQEFERAKSLLGDAPKRRIKLMRK